jgi:hypothetical protein
MHFLGITGTLLIVLNITGCPETDVDLGIQFEVISVNLSTEIAAATDVPLDISIVVEFSPALTPVFKEQIPGFFSLKKLDNTIIPVTIGWSANDKTAVFSPTGGFEANTEYIFDMEAADLTGTELFPLTFTTLTPTLEITDTATFSYGFYLTVTSNLHYLIQGDDGTGWVDISGIMSAAAGEKTRYTWSSFNQFAVPVSLNLRAVSDNWTSDTIIITPEVASITSISDDEKQAEIVLDDSGADSATEAWVEIVLAEERRYFFYMHRSVAVPTMDGTLIRILDSTGSLVIDATTGEPLVADDEDNGSNGLTSFSNMEDVHVPKDGTYYILIQPDNASADKSVYQPNLADYGSVILSYGYID